MGVEPCSSGAKIKVDEFYPAEHDDPPLLDWKKIDNIRSNVKFETCYEITRHIGDGKFGKVFQVRERATGDEYAAKFIKIRKEADRREVEREVSILTHLRHPRIAQIYDAFYTTTNDVVLIMEIVRGGELFDRVADESYVLTEQAVAVIICQLCEAIEYIHQQNILHLDIKPENIMCVTQTGNRIKLIDFGLARHYDGNQELKYMAGTPEFAAPEVIKFENLDYHTDMWSVGVITYILLSGYSPFLGDNLGETYCNVEKGEWEFYEEFDKVSEEAKDFITKLLVYDQKKRMLPIECLAHPWISKHRARARDDVLLEKPSEGPKIDNKQMMRYNAKRKFRRMIIYVKFLIEMNRLRNSLRIRMSEHGQKFFDPLLKMAEQKEKKMAMICDALPAKKKSLLAVKDELHHVQHADSAPVVKVELPPQEEPKPNENGESKEPKKKTVKKQKAVTKDGDAPPKKKISPEKKEKLRKSVDLLGLPPAPTAKAASDTESETPKKISKKFPSDNTLNVTAPAPMQRSSLAETKAEKKPQKTESSDSTKENRVDPLRKASAASTTDALTKRTSLGLSATEKKPKLLGAETPAPAALEKKSALKSKADNKETPTISLVKSRLQNMENESSPLLMNVSAIKPLKPPTTTAETKSTLESRKTSKASIGSLEVKTVKSEKSSDDEKPKIKIVKKKKVSVDVDGKPIVKVLTETPKTEEVTPTVKKVKTVLSSKSVELVDTTKTDDAAPTVKKVKTIVSSKSIDLKKKSAKESLRDAAVPEEEVRLPKIIIKKGKSVDVPSVLKKEDSLETIKEVKKTLKPKTVDKPLTSESETEKKTEGPVVKKIVKKKKIVDSEKKPEESTSPAPISFTNQDKKLSLPSASLLGGEKRVSMDEKKKVRFGAEPSLKPATPSTASLSSPKKPPTPPIGLLKTKSERCIPSEIKKKSSSMDARVSKDDHEVTTRKKMLQSSKSEDVFTTREDFSFENLRAKLLRRVSAVDDVPKAPPKQCVSIAKTHSVKERLQRFNAQ